MAYQALYRAFRPATFTDIVGQEAITTTLKNQVRDGRVAHAYLFCGSRGTGKTTTARVLARAVNCLSPRDGCEPCGECEICRSIAAERLMDVVEIDAASNNSVDEIRDLREKIKYPPSAAHKKVYIIDEVHMLSSGAFNALLKTLEEPPAHAVLILATTEPNKLPATILSRCQRFDFRRYAADVIVAQLRSVCASLSVAAETAALDEIARAAEGGMRDALSLLDTCLSYGSGAITLQNVMEAAGLSGREALFGFADALLSDDVAGAFAAIDALVREGRDPQAFAREAAGHLRALLVARAVGTDLEETSQVLDCTKEDAGRYIAQGAKGSDEKITRMLDAFLRCESDMKWVSQPRGALELCAFLCCRPPEQVRLDALVERIGRLESALSGTNAGPAAAAPAGLAALGERLDRLESALSGKDRSDPVSPPSAERASHDAHASDPGEASEPQTTAPETASKKPSVKASVKASAKPGEPSGAIAGKEKWDEAMKLVGDGNPSMRMPLTKAEFAGLEGGTAIGEFAKNDNMFLKILDNDARKEIISAALSKAFGQRVTVSFRLRGTGTPAKDSDPERTQTIRQARELFGRENVDFLDD